MSKILIGSKILKKRGYVDSNKDIDYATDDLNDLELNTKEIEHIYIPPLFDEKHKELRTNNVLGELSLTMDGLFTLKASHMFWDINWNKHMFQISNIFSKYHFKIDRDLFYDLYNYWQTYHERKNKRSNLNQSAKEFFTNQTNFIHPHDDLHELLIKDTKYKIPAYKHILKDGEEVDVDENKFNNLDQETKIRIVVEEIMVMAFERYSEMSENIAFKRMLKKFILSHAPLWEAIFIFENINTILSSYDKGFIDKLNKYVK